MTRNNDKLLTMSQEDLLMVLSAASTRASLASRFGKSYGDKRDIYTALGWNKTPIYKDYLQRYVRQDIAKRIVDLPVKACWRKVPEITESKDTETPFERAWLDILKEKRIFAALSRADRLSRIGQYGIILLGLSDSNNLDDPAERAQELNFISSFGEGNLSIPDFVRDSSDPRFRLPENYSVTVTDEGDHGQTLKVHWSRTIHIAEDRLDSEVFGTPALASILNMLQNLELVAGSSAEMFWRGALPGIAFKIAADASIQGQSAAQFADEIDNYLHDLKRDMRLQGIEPQQLAPEIADPRGHVDVYLDLIAGAKGIPKRILVGSERGELASTQDQRNFAEMIDERRRDHCESVILRPFIDRLIEVGVLPAPSDGYVVVWPDLLVPSEKDRVEVGEIRARAISAFTNAFGADQIIPPEVALEVIAALDDDVVERIKDILGEIGIDADGGGEEEEE